jgi:hypothetical protein
VAAEWRGDGACAFDVFVEAAKRLRLRLRPAPVRVQVRAALRVAVALAQATRSARLSTAQASATKSTRQFGSKSFAASSTFSRTTQTRHQRVCPLSFLSSWHGMTNCSGAASSSSRTAPPLLCLIPLASVLCSEISTPLSNDLLQLLLEFLQDTTDYLLWFVKSARGSAPDDSDGASGFLPPALTLLSTILDPTAEFYIKTENDP